MSQTPATITEQIALSKPSQPTQGANATLTPADFLRIVRGRLVLISVLFIFFSILTVGGWVVWYKYFPTYSATCPIQFKRFKPMEQDSLTNPQTNKDEHERYMYTEAAKITAPGMLSELIKSPEFQNTNWYKTAEKKDWNKLEELKDHISAAPQKNTNIIHLTMQARDPEDPPKIVKQLARLYEAQFKDASLSDLRAQRTRYELEEKNIQTEIDGYTASINNMAEELPEEMVNTDDQTGMTPFQIRILNAEQQVRELKMNVMELDSIYQAYSNPTQPYTKEDVMMIELNPQVQQLQSQVWALEQEIETQLKRLGRNHRTIKQLENRKDQVQKQLDQVREQKLRDQVSVRLQQAETAKMSAEVSLRQAQLELREIKDLQADFNRKYQNFRQLKENLTFAREQKIRIQEHLDNLYRIIDTNTAVEVSAGLNDVSDPTSPSMPKILFLPGFIILSLGLSIGIAVLLEMIDTSVRSPQDIVRYLRSPILGTIPDADDEELDIDQVELAVDRNPQSLLAEAFRSVRSALQFSAPADRLQRILITSPKPEDGKTTIATNLAYSLANSGKRVLLVDANFRRPHLRGIFKNIGKDGLSNILVGSGTLKDYVAKTNLSNLDVLGSGPTPPNPAEHLAGNMMSQFLDDTSKTYDHIIIDAPPALLVSDSLILSTLVDGTILVLRAKENSRGMAMRALRTLQQANAHSFGVILNAAPMRSGGYFKEQLQSYYDYQEEQHDALPHPPADKGQKEDEDKD